MAIHAYGSNVKTSKVLKKTPQKTGSISASAWDTLMEQLVLHWKSKKKITTLLGCLKCSIVISITCLENIGAY